MKETFNIDIRFYANKITFLFAILPKNIIYYMYVHELCDEENLFSRFCAKIELKLTKICISIKQQIR